MILAKIEGKEAKLFSKIYQGHKRIWFRSKKLFHACVPAKNHGKCAKTKILKIPIVFWL
jgi:hypothetical protein